MTELEEVKNELEEIKRLIQAMPQAIADAVAARLMNTMGYTPLTVEEEISAVRMRGGDLAEHLKAKAKAGMIRAKRIKKQDNKR